MSASLIAAALIATSAHATVPDPAPVVAAERAFAADGLKMGVKPSFLKHSRPDAIMISDQPRTVTQVFADAPDPTGKEPSLVWWPLWAGIARSGELGFSTGPIEVGGKRTQHYFTIWQKQADGGWKWVYDGGGGGAAKDEAVQGSPVAYLPLATAHAASPAAAMAEVKAAEAALAAGIKTDQVAAHLAALAEDGRVYVGPLPPAKGRADFPTVLAGFPQSMDFSAPMGGGSSDGADLVWTYGPARWARDGAPRSGHYVHVWQKRTEGWKLVFAQMVSAPPPAPATPAPPANG